MTKLRRAQRGRWHGAVRGLLCVVVALGLLVLILELAIPSSQIVTYCGRGGDSVILTSNGEYWLTGSSLGEVPKNTGVVIRVSGQRVNLQGLHGYMATVEEITVVDGAVPASCPTP